MSIKNVEKLLNLVKSNENLQKELILINEKLQKEEGNEEKIIADNVVPLAKKNGIIFTADDFLQYANEQMSALSEEDLLNVSGGTNAKRTAMAWLFAGITAASFAAPAVQQFLSEQPTSSAVAGSETKSSGKDSRNTQDEVNTGARHDNKSRTHRKTKVEKENNNENEAQPGKNVAHNEASKTNEAEQKNRRDVMQNKNVVLPNNKAKKTPAAPQINVAPQTNAAKPVAKNDAPTVAPGAVEQAKHAEKVGGYESAVADSKNKPLTADEASYLVKNFRKRTSLKLNKESSKDKKAYKLLKQFTITEAEVLAQYLNSTIFSFEGKQFNKKIRGGIPAGKSGKIIPFVNESLLLQMAAHENFGHIIYPKAVTTDTKKADTAKPAVKKDDTGKTANKTAEATAKKDETIKSAAKKNEVAKPVAKATNEDTSKKIVTSTEESKESAKILYSGECGEKAKWSFDEDGTFTISGTGPLQEYGYNEEPFPDEIKYSVKRIIIEEGITSLKNFFVFPFVASIDISASLTELNADYFKACHQLESINVNEDNTEFKSIDGVLFSKDGTKLLCYPGGKTDPSYTIPTGVTSIDKGAFFASRFLNNLIISSSVSEIGENAFASSEIKTVVYLGDNEPNFGGHASGVNNSTQIFGPNNFNGETFGGIAVTKVEDINAKSAEFSNTGAVEAAEHAENVGGGITDYSSWHFWNRTVTSQAEHLVNFLRSLPRTQNGLPDLRYVSEATRVQLEADIIHVGSQIRTEKDGITLYLSGKNFIEDWDTVSQPNLRMLLDLYNNFTASSTDNVSAEVKREAETKQEKKVTFAPEVEKETTTKKEQKEAKKDDAVKPASKTIDKSEDKAKKAEGAGLKETNSQSDENAEAAKPEQKAYEKIDRSRTTPQLREISHFYDFLESIEDENEIVDVNAITPETVNDFKDDAQYVVTLLNSNETLRNSFGEGKTNYIKSQLEDHVDVDEADYAKANAWRADTQLDHFVNFSRKYHVSPETQETWEEELDDLNSKIRISGTENNQPVYALFGGDSFWNQTYTNIPQEKLISVKNLAAERNMLASQAEHFNNLEPESERSNNKNVVSAEHDKAVSQTENNLEAFKQIGFKSGNQKYERFDYEKLSVEGKFDSKDLSEHILNDLDNFENLDTESQRGLMLDTIALLESVENKSKGVYEDWRLYCDDEDDIEELNEEIYKYDGKLYDLKEEYSKIPENKREEKKGKELEEKFKQTLAERRQKINERDQKQKELEKLKELVNFYFEKVEPNYENIVKPTNDYEELLARDNVEFESVEDFLDWIAPFIDNFYNLDPESQEVVLYYIDDFFYKYSDFVYNKETKEDEIRLRADYNKNTKAIVEKMIEIGKNNIFNQGKEFGNQKFSAMDYVKAAGATIVFAGAVAAYSIVVNLPTWVDFFFPAQPKKVHDPRQEITTEDKLLADAETTLINAKNKVTSFATKAVNKVTSTATEVAKKVKSYYENWRNSGPTENANQVDTGITPANATHLDPLGKTPATNLNIKNMIYDYDLSPENFPTSQQTMPEDYISYIDWAEQRGEKPMSYKDFCYNQKSTPEKIKQRASELKSKIFGGSNSQINAKPTDNPPVNQVNVGTASTNSTPTVTPAPNPAPVPPAFGENNANTSTKTSNGFLNIFKNMFGFGKGETPKASEVTQSLQQVDYTVKGAKKVGSAAAEMLQNPHIDLGGNNAGAITPQPGKSTSTAVANPEDILNNFPDKGGLSDPIAYRYRYRKDPDKKVKGKSVDEAKYQQDREIKEVNWANPEESWDHWSKRIFNDALNGAKSKVGNLKDKVFGTEKPSVSTTQANEKTTGGGNTNSTQNLTKINVAKEAIEQLPNDGGADKRFLTPKTEETTDSASGMVNLGVPEPANRFERGLMKFGKNLKDPGKNSEKVEDSTNTLPHKKSPKAQPGPKPGPTEHSASNEGTQPATKSMWEKVEDLVKFGKRVAKEEINLYGDIVYKDGKGAKNYEKRGTEARNRLVKLTDADRERLDNKPPTLADKAQDAFKYGVGKLGDKGAPVVKSVHNNLEQIGDGVGKVVDKTGSVLKSVYNSGKSAVKDLSKFTSKEGGAKEYVSEHPIAAGVEGSVAAGLAGAGAYGVFKVGSAAVRGVKSLLANPHGNCGGYGADEIAKVTWEFDKKTGTLIISGNAYMANFGGNVPLPWEDYKDKINTVEIKTGVKAIGVDAFKDCVNLTTVTISEENSELQFIAQNAFYNCKSLISINIPRGVQLIGLGAFYNCTSLESITIPDTMTDILGNAFYGCSGLTHINIPDRVTEIGENAFYGCSGLTHINIPASVTEIGACAFAGCTGLFSVSLPNSMKSMGKNVFSGCTNLSLAVYNGAHNFANTMVGAGGAGAGEPTNVFENCGKLEKIAVLERIYNNSTFCGKNVEKFDANKIKDLQNQIALGLPSMTVDAAEDLVEGLKDINFDDPNLNFNEENDKKVEIHYGQGGKSVKTVTYGELYKSLKEVYTLYKSTIENCKKNTKLLFLDKETGKLVELQGQLNINDDSPNFNLNNRQKDTLLIRAADKVFAKAQNDLAVMLLPLLDELPVKNKNEYVSLKEVNEFIDSVKNKKLSFEDGYAQNKDKLTEEEEKFIIKFNNTNIIDTISKNPRCWIKNDRGNKILYDGKMEPTDSGKIGEDCTIKRRKDMLRTRFLHLFVNAHVKAIQKKYAPK